MFIKGFQVESIRALYRVTFGTLEERESTTWRERKGLKPLTKILLVLS